MAPRAEGGGKLSLEVLGVGKTEAGAKRIAENQ